MLEIARILAPIDFSTHSRLALDYAVAVARRYGSVVTVLHVFPADTTAHGGGAPPFDPLVLHPEDRTRLLAEMEAFSGAEAAPGVELVPRVRQGDPTDEILDEADRLPADLLVLGTHGRSGADRLVLGSVAEHVLRRARGAVLTVPRRAPEAVPLSAAVFTRILCAVDLSPGSMHGLAYALALTQAGGGRLTLVSVLPRDVAGVPVPAGAPRHEAQVALARHRTLLAERARVSLMAAVPPHRWASGQIETVVTDGNAGAEILRVAAGHHCDLIVMGVPHRTAVGRLVFGSTALQVVREAGCPVLTARAAPAG